MSKRVHSNVVSWGIDLLKERRRYRDWSSWMVNARNRVMMIRDHRRKGEKAVVKVNYAALDEPVYVRLGSPDLWVLDELFQANEYRDVVNADLGQVRQIVDLGANAGMSLRYWLQKWPDARIIGVEPDPDNFAVASKNAAQHRGGGNVRMVRACVAASERTVTLNRSGHESMYTMTEAAESPATDTVPAYPLSRILEENSALPEIDLLKCDIEGAEREVFGACGDWIGRVRHMVLEIHPPYTAEQLLTDCERNGTRFRINTRHASPPNEIAFLSRVD